MGPFGFGEIAFIFFLALIIFGPRKLPELGKTLGKGLREFKKATSDLQSNWEEHLRDAESPVHDIKQTIHEVSADMEESARIDDHTAPATPGTPEETKPDATH